MSTATSACDATFDLMNLALDHEASGDEQIELDRHLQQCPQCRDTWARLRSFRFTDVISPPPLGNRAHTIAHHVLDRKRRHQARLGWLRPGPFSAWRALAASLLVATLTTFSAALTIGAHLHVFIWQSDVTVSPQVYQEIVDWMGRLPLLTGDVFTEVANWSLRLSLLLGLVGIAIIGPLRRIETATAALGLSTAGLLLFPLALMPFALCDAVNHTLVGGIPELWRWICGWCVLSISVGWAVVTRHVRGTGAALATFLVAIALGALLEFETALPSVLGTNAPPLAGALSLFDHVFAPSVWIPWMLTASALCGLCGGLLLYSLPREAWRVSLAAVVVLVLFSALAWHRFITIPDFPRAPLINAGVPDVPRTVVLLGPRTADGSVRTAAYPVPGPLASFLETPTFRSLCGPPYRWASAWADSLRFDRALLDWDHPAMLEAVAKAAARTPGVEACTVAMNAAMQAGDRSAWQHYYGGDPARDGQSARRAGAPGTFRSGLGDFPAGVAATRPHPELIRGRVVLSANYALLPASFARHQNLPLCQTYTVRGRLVRNGAPLAHVTVRIMSEALTAQAASDVSRVANGIIDHLRDEVEQVRQQLKKPVNWRSHAWTGPPGNLLAARTDDDGRFVLEGVPSGIYVLMVLLPGQVDHLTLTHQSTLEMRNVPPGAVTDALDAQVYVEVRNADVDAGTYTLTRVDAP